MPSPSHGITLCFSCFPRVKPPETRSRLCSGNTSIIILESRGWWLVVGTERLPRSPMFSLHSERGRRRPISESWNSRRRHPTSEIGHSNTKDVASGPLACHGCARPRALGGLVEFCWWLMMPPFPLDAFRYSMPLFHVHCYIHSLHNPLVFRIHNSSVEVTRCLTNGPR
jgi:hypothetical protein